MIAASYKHVPNRDLAQGFFEEIRQFFAGGDPVKVRFVFLSHRRQVETVIMGVIEKVAFNAPSLPIDLLPHGSRLNVDFHGFKLQWTFAGLGLVCAGGRLFSAGSSPLFVFAIKQFLAIE